MRLARWLSLVALGLALLAGCTIAHPGGAPAPTAAPLTPTPAVRGCDPATSPPLPLDSAGDPLYPSLGNAGYDALHYSLDLTADPAANTITGTTAIGARALQDLDAFTLDFHGLTIQSLAVDGAPADYQRNGDKLHVALSPAVKDGQVFTTTVTYGGAPQTIVSPASWRPLGWQRAATGTYVVSEPSGAENWYPVNDYPCDKATYDLRITVPKPWVATGNGTLQGTEDRGDATTYIWRARDPVASYLVAVNVGNFVLRTGTSPGGLPLRSYYLSAVADSVAPLFDRTGDTIDFYSSLFGPYPFDAYGMVVVDTGLGNWAMENQTLSLFARDVTSGRAESIGPHELAHQWFGDSVSLKSWKDVWLNEGFATYAEALWYEHVNGTQAFEARMQASYPGAGSTALFPPGNPPATDLFNTSVYTRGALTLHALRRKVGDDAFYRILRTYADRYRYGNASTSDFIALAQEVSGQDLRALFQGWLYDPGVPAYPPAPPSLFQKNRIFPQAWRLELWRSQGLR